jgi:4-amino-4-deoxy-L-arabinose transferase-like glycosyltransferase
VLALAALAVAGAANHQLWAYDEPREAELARAMWRSGNYIYTVLGDRPFLEKPPLFSITVALAFHLFGEASAPVARIVAALWATLSLAGVWWFAKRAIGERAGLVAALVCATSGRFFTVAHTILLDNALCAATTIALGAGWIAGREGRRGLAAVAWAALGVAFLTKGLVGVAIVAVVLGLDLSLRRDKRGALTLLHPLAVACFVVPAVAYTILLYRAGGPLGGEFVEELLWRNQLGRFLEGYATRHEKWYVYLTSWPEMLAPWTPLALVALVAPFLTKKEARATDPSSSADEASLPGVDRFLWIWAVVPLVLLTISKGKARNYALPVVPGYALLIASFWHTNVLGNEHPIASKRVFRALAHVIPLGVLAAAGFFAHDASQIRLDLDARPRHVSSVDGLVLMAALLALATGCACVWNNRGGRLAGRESGALLICLAVVSGFLLYSSAYFARRGDLNRSYEGLARDVWKQAGSRRLLLYHAHDSWSGTFAFLADRSTPEFNEGWDPRGERLLEAIGPATSDVAFSCRDALRSIDEARRRELVVEWSGTREADHCNPEKLFYLLHRRRPGEAARDPLQEEKRGP